METLSSKLFAMVSEAMVSNIKNLSLYMDDDKEIIALYDADKAISAADEYDYDGVSDSILGVVELKYHESTKAMMVDSIFAEKGYGPVMYLIGMYASGDMGLSPTRTSKITSDAKKVWKEFYDGKGKNLVTHEPIKNSTIHKEDYLNQIYYADKPKGYDDAIKNHMEVYGGEFAQMMEEEIDAKLSNAMRSIY